jgi:hypothetical protein
MVDWSHIEVEEQSVERVLDNDDDDPFPLGANAETAETRGCMQDDIELSLSSAFKKVEHPGLMFVGINGLVAEV